MKPGKTVTIFLSVVIFIVLPFVFSTKLQDVEQSPRFLFLSGIVALSSIFSFISFIKNTAILKKHFLLYVLLMFLIILVISFARSINYGDGLFEMMKLLLLISLFFQFVFVLSADESNKLIFLKAICISALIFIAFGFFQILPGLKGDVKLTIDFSISSTLGNKNFFSETLVMMLPLTALSITLFVSYWRIIAIIATVLILITIIILQTTTAWVAVFFSTILMVILLFRFRKKLLITPVSPRIFKLVLISIIIFSVSSAFLFLKLAGTKQIVYKIQAFQELIVPNTHPYHSMSQNSIYERSWLVRNSIKMINEHPVFGVGLANWKIYYPKYGLGSAPYMSTENIRFIHPHNDYLLIACEMGIIGLLIFIALIAVLFYYCRAVIIKADDQRKIFVALALFFGLSAYIFISLFSMPLYRFYPPLLFVFFMALIFTEYSKVVVTKKSFDNKLTLLICFVSFLIGCYSMFIGFKRLSADSNLSAALLLEWENNWTGMRRHLDTIDKNVFPLDVTATPVAWYQGFAFFYSGDIEKARGYFEEAESVNPYHLKVLNDLGSCYNLSGDTKTAKQYFRNALKIQPGFDDAIVNLSIVYFNEGLVDSSYSTLIGYSGKIKPSSVNVFSTIIQAKAKTITSNEESLEWLRNQTSKPSDITRLIENIKTSDRGIHTVLEKR